MNVEIVHQGEVTGQNFSVQLKATDRSLIKRKRPTVRLKTSALEYIRSRPEPVMLVLYSASDHDALWIWSEGIAEKPSDGQKTISVSVPNDQRLGEIEWEKVRSHVRQFFLAKPKVDQRTASKLERFGRIRINLSRAALLLREEVDHFEKLVNDPKVRQVDLQRFIEAHPEVFLGGEYVRLHPMIFLYDEEDGFPLMPDFFLESVTGFCDILEMRLPRQRIVSGKRHRRHYAAGVNKGIAQVLRYYEFFSDRRHRELVSKRYGLNVFRPQTTLLVGRDSEFKDMYEKKRLESHLLSVRILTYDDLIRMARARQIT